MGKSDQLQLLQCAILDNVAYGIISTTPDGTVTSFNPAAERLLGYAADEIVGKQTPALWHDPEEIARHAMELSKEFGETVPPGFDVFAARPLRSLPEEGEWTFVRRDGGRIPVNLSVTALWDESGHITGFVGLIYDLSERKRAEAALAASEQQFRSLAENSPDNIIRYDRQCRARYYNPRMLQTLGIDPGKILGLTPVELGAGGPDGDAAYETHIRQVLESGESTDMELTLRQPGGRASHHLIRFAAERNAEGTIVGVLAIGRDVTELKQAEMERLSHLYFFESMDAVNRAIQGAGDLEQMMRDVLDVVLSIFNCDRAFLMYPCDPEAASWSVPMERNRSEYPGASARGLEIPMDADVARTLRELLASDDPVKFGPETAHPLPDDIARQFGFLSFMSIAIYPKAGKPWQFGIHQCSYARVWTADEERLLRAIGRRLADGLTGLLSYRDLRASEELFRALVENSPDFIARYDREYRRIYVNPAIQKLFGGTTPEDVPGKTPASRSPVLAPQVYIDQLKRVIDTGAECDAEIPFRTARGELHWGHMRFAPEFGAEGTVVSVLAIGRDIHEIKESELHFRMLAENFPDFVSRFDREGRHMYVNPAIERAFGLPADAIIGKTPLELPGVRTPQQNEALLALIRRALAEGVVNESEAHWSLPTGERIVEIRQVPERDAAGDVISALSIAHDITERKRAEEALQKSEALLNTAQRLTKVGGWEFDIKTGESFWTEELYRIHEMPNDPGIDHLKESLACYGPEDRQIISEAFQRACEQGESYDLEFPFTTYAGKPLWIRTTAQPVYEDGRVVRLVGNLMDITERKQAEEEIRKLNQDLEQRVTDRTAQLEAANRELEAFAYSVSHDLRAPLRAIDGFVSLLNRRLGPGLDEQDRRYMTTISGAARRMGMLINDLLSFSRMGRSEMVRTDVDLGGLVREIIREFDPETKERTIEWRVASLPPVTGDRAMLRVVLVNLISNALKFTRPRARASIEVGCIPGESETVIFVSDNGVGFDMQYADKLFGVFQRLHGMEEFEGTGIGLANVRRIIQRHGGRTWAEGKVDGGATFYFSLPRRPEASEPQETVHVS